MMPRSHRSPVRLTAYRLVLAATLMCVPDAARAQAPFTVLHHFVSPPAKPKARLVEAADGTTGTHGTLLGTASEGGVYGRGSVYAVAPGSSRLTVLHDFNGSDGYSPSASLIRGADGAFYGTTVYGGSHNHGVVFRITVSGAFQILHSFDYLSDGANPLGRLLQTSDNSLYGTTSAGGPGGSGSVFRLNPDGSLTTLHAFSNNGTGDGVFPFAGIVLAADGNFYGTTVNGGTSGYGTLFRMTPGGVVTVVHSFDPSGGGGIYPYAEPTVATNGSVYGTTFDGGVGLFPAGTIYQFDPTGTGTFKTLHSFSYGDGAFPQAGLIQANDGKLYGTTLNGGAAGHGTIFSIGLAGGLSQLHSFTHDIDGAYLYGGLFQSSDGQLYGATNDGPHGQFTVFKSSLFGDFSTVAEFPTPMEGSFLDGGLVRAPDGQFYGTAWGGGLENRGTIFRMSTAGAVTPVYSFDQHSKGTNPYSSLILGSDGALYGSTVNGGTSGFGAIFKKNQDGTVTTLHSFNGFEGANPYGRLIQLSDGNFYGTTLRGGTGYGTIFQMTPSGSLSKLHWFDYTDGAYARSSLVQGADGRLYGTAESGGQFGYGVVFSVDLAGSYSILHHFNNGDGAQPTGGLTKVFDGTFFGLTAAGGDFGNGTIFKMTSTEFATVRSFSNSEGSSPWSTMVQGPDGTLYGTTTAGGAFGLGTAFKFDPATNAFTILHAFSIPEGTNPYAPLAIANGALYGTTPYNGLGGGGTIFRIEISPSPTLTWGAPPAIIYGTPLGNAQLNATANMPGTFVYSPPAGTVLSATPGQTLSVTFTPTDSNYTKALATVTIDVLMATPVINWSNPADITYGTALGATQLNASAGPPGTFVYLPPSGTVLNAGAAQSLSVTFTPADTANYPTARRTVAINVRKAGQTITFGALPSKTYGDAPFTVAATASSGLGVSFSIVSGPAIVVSNTVTLTGAGTVKVRASQAGTGNYNAADDVDQAFSVQAGPIGVPVDPYPTILGSFITSSYNATTGAFAANGWVITLDTGSGRTGITTTFKLLATIDSTGRAQNGSLTVGKATAPLLYSATLLQFGFNATALEFLFAPIAGSYIPSVYVANKPLDVLLAGLGTGFPGAFTTSWSSSSNTVQIREDAKAGQTP